MHPNAAFRMDEDAARAFVADEGFGMVFVSTPSGPAVTQVPVVANADGALRFHVARGNRVTPHLDGATALFVVQGPHAYIPPRWYAAGPDEVPTWNYVSVEVEGTVRALDRAALRDQLDALTATFESAPAWSMDQMNPGKAEAMMHAIVAFELVPTAWRGTAKLSQNKSAEIRARVTEQLADHALGRWMRAA